MTACVRYNQQNYRNKSYLDPAPFRADCMKKVVYVFLTLALCLSATAQPIISDNFNATSSGTGFSLNQGVNSGINPPATRLTGTASANLRYIPTSTKPNSAFAITSNKLQVNVATNAGRFVLSANGSTPFDLAPAFGSTAATTQKPVVYDLSISMANNSPSTQRFSFAIASAEGDATTWGFGVQLFRTANEDNFYTIGKRIDTAASGLAVDLNTFITNTVPGSSGTEVTFVIRVTDAGAETSSFHSRVQVSMDGGFTWIYDTATDPDLPNGWRFIGPGRYVIWDIAPSAGPVTYDNFSVVPVPVSAGLTAPANGASNFGATASLRAIPSNAAPGNVTVTYFGRQAPKPYPGPDFLIPVLPDTQNYAREASGSGNATMEMWYSQTEWIITNRVRQNIPFVATLGDCVQNGDILNGNSNTTEWRNATNAMYRLENPARTLLNNGIPYLVSVGNHDQEPNGDPDGTTDNYNKYFGTSHFVDMPYYGGHFSTNNDTWFALFSVSGLDFIVLSFEYGRYGSTVLGWADDVLATNQNRRVIVLTHFAGDDTPDDTTVSPFSAQGQAIYDELKTNPNFFLMLGGHVFNEGGEGRRTDTFNGHTVHTLISDYQGRINGGNGLMRVMTFSPSNNLVSVKTYSPYTDAYETDGNSQFSFSYNMQPNGAGSPGTPWVALGTNTNVPPGAQNSFVWTGLQASKTYEWYVKVTDSAGNTFLSSSRVFTTTANTAPVATNRTVTVIGDQPTTFNLVASDANADVLAFRTNSQPTRGLTYNFDPATGTITYLPTHGYRGTDRFTFAATDSVAISASANLDLVVNAPPDLNSNGLPDAWEVRYGVTDPNGDDDGDGQSNLNEYFANTNPTNSASSLRVTNAAMQPNGDIVLTWSTVGGTRYRLQYCDGDANGGFNGPLIDIVRPIQSEMDPARTARLQRRLLQMRALCSNLLTRRATIGSKLCSEVDSRNQYQIVKRPVLAIV